MISTTIFTALSLLCVALLCFISYNNGFYKGATYTLKKIEGIFEEAKDKQE